MTNQSLFSTFKRTIYLIKILANAALRIHKKEKKQFLAYIKCNYLISILKLNLTF